jgi:pSer/pThr/pTyr-binding forkhead associated (FHA) protein
LGEPLRLEPGEVVALGREEDCHIRILSATVSRRHAQISFDGVPPKPTLADCKTKNGTYVNGQEIHGPYELKDKDVIGLGEVSAVYRALHPGTDEAALYDDAVALPHMKETQTLRIEKFNATDLTGLRGGIAWFPLDDLMARISTLGATGTLVVLVDHHKGTVVFNKGVMQTARFLDKDGQAALETISELRRGSFEFEPYRGNP